MCPLPALLRPAAACVLACARRWWLLVKARPQRATAHTKGRSWVCTRRCFFRSLRVVNTLAHSASGQLKVLPANKID